MGYGETTGRLQHTACNQATAFDAILHWQIHPLPRFVRWLPIPGLQRILGADAAMAKYLKDLYEQADEKSPDGRWSLMVCTAPVGETAVDSLRTQETYKAYHDPETGEQLTSVEVGAELSVMLVAGGSDAIVEICTKPLMTTTRYGDHGDSFGLLSIPPGSARGYMEDYPSGNWSGKASSSGLY